MQTIKNNWYFYLYLIIVICIGLYLNHFSFNRLPFGEDDMYYFGTMKRFLDYGLGDLNLIKLTLHAENRLLLFYILFWPWQFIKNITPIINYMNILYLLTYLGGFFSFLRLTNLNDTKINKYLLPLFYVLLISNGFWLGPRYFVPALWLYIAIPNIIYCSLKRKYIESAVWTILTLFFYSFGFSLAILALVISTTLVHLKPVWLKFIFSIIVFALFYFFGMKYVGNFINSIHIQSIIEGDVLILNNFYLAFMSIVILSLLISILYKLPIYWDQIFVSLLLFFIFYIIATTFPKDASAYRIIIILYSATALALNSFPNVFANNNWLHLSLGAVMSIILLYYAFQLFLVNIDQTNRDAKAKSVLPEEIALFEQIDNKCQAPNCLIISDPATMQIGTYFNSNFNKFDYYNFYNVLNDPEKFSDTELNYDHVFLIVSKRTSAVYNDTKTADDYIIISRSYFQTPPDPLNVFKKLQPYQNKEFYANSNVGLYALWIK